MPELTRPEGQHNEEIYEDTGCEAAPKCLECPLPTCRHDDPPGYQRWRLLQRDKARIATMDQEVLTVEQAAERFNIGVRTMFRIKERVREEPIESGLLQA